MLSDYITEACDWVYEKMTVKIMISVLIIIFLAGVYFYFFVMGETIFLNANDCKSSNRTEAFCEYAENVASQALSQNIPHFSSVEACRDTYRMGNCTYDMKSWRVPTYQPKLAGFSVSEDAPASDDHSWFRAKDGKYDQYYIRPYYHAQSYKIYRAPNSTKNYRRYDSSRHHSTHHRYRKSRRSHF